MTGADVAASWYLIYDGDCAFCLRWVSWFQARDRDRRLVFIPFQEPAELARLPAIPRSALERAMHLVSLQGDIYAGAAALPPILGLLPWGWTLSWLFKIPGVPWLADRMYRLVARNRHRLGCGSATCTLGGSHDG